MSRLEQPGLEETEGELRLAAADWLLMLGWLLLALVGPLAFSAKAAATFFTAKLGPVYTGAAFMLLAVSIHGSPPGRWRERLQRPVRPTVEELLALAFLGTGLLSLASAASPATAFIGAYNQGTGWLFWFAALTTWSATRRLRPTPKLVHGLLLAAVVAGVIVALIALLQAFQWDYLRFRIGLRPDGRAGSTLGNPLYLGTYLAMLAIPAAHYAAKARSVAITATMLAVTVILITGIATTWSRGAWLALGAGLLTWLAFALGGPPPRRRPAVIGLAVVAASMLLALVVAPVWTPSRGSSVPVPGKVQADAGVVSGSDASTVQTRIIMWRTALDATKARPILGWGPNNFRFAALRFMRPEKLRLEPATRDADAHSLPLEVASTWGLPSLALLAAWAAMILRSLRARRTAPTVAITAGVMMAFVVGSLTMPQNIVLTPLALGFVGLGLSAPPFGDGTRVSPSFSGRISTAIRVGAAVLGVFFLGLAIAGSFAWFRADTRYLTGELRQDRSLLLLAAEGFPLADTYWNALGLVEAGSSSSTLVTEGIRHFRRGLDISPQAAEIRIALAGLYLQRGDWRVAEQEVETALVHAPLEPQAHAYLAYALLRRHDTRRAEEEAQTALASPAQSPELLYTVGLYYRDAGSTDRANELFQQALALDPGFRPALAALGRFR